MGGQRELDLFGYVFLSRSSYQCASKCAQEVIATVNVNM